MPRAGLVPAPARATAAGWAVRQPASRPESVAWQISPGGLSSSDGNVRAQVSDG